MSWTEVDLANVSAEMEKVPEGTYVFSVLPGAKYNQWNPNKIEVGAKITEGEYSGRVVYFSYGDPAKVPAMIGAFKRLEIALAKNTGVSIEEGQDPVAYLNTVAGGLFVAPVKHRVIPAKEDDPESQPDTRVEIGVFKVKAVPEAA